MILTSGYSAMDSIKLIPLEDSDREHFILDNQEAFNYGALEEFGLKPVCNKIVNR